MKWYLNIRWQDIALFISVMILLLLPDMYLVAAHDEFGIGFVLCGALFVLPLALLIISIPNKIVQIILLTIVNGITLLEVSTVFTYYDFIHAICFPAFIYSTSGEMGDMSYYIIHKTVKHEILPIITYLFAFVVICVQTPKKREEFAYRWILSGILSVVAIIMSAFVCRAEQHSPYHVVREITTAIQLKMQREALLPLSNSFCYHAYSDTTTQIVCVLGIGESLNYEHCSLNGSYSRKTMPNLEIVDNLTLFSNYYANATYTQQALPLLLSRATPENFSSVYSERSILSAFSEAGFKTCVLSNKNQIMNNGVDNYLLCGADVVSFVDNDKDIIAALDSISQSTTRNVFVLLHFLGNHFFYSNYPKYYNVWTPNYTYSREIENDSLFINAYDNSILYADSLLSASIHCLKDKTSIFMFVSDHGEYLDAHIGGHGLTCNPTKEEYHVPLMVWTSEKYREIYPTKAENVEKHKDEPVCADNVFWSVLDMAGVKVDEELQQDGMSIFGDTLLPHERNLLLPDGRSIMSLD